MEVGMSHFFRTSRWVMPAPTLIAPSRQDQPPPSDNRAPLLDMDHELSDEEEKKRLRHRIGRQRWKGDDMELKRKNPGSDFKAVDFEEFRNYDVGKGYQAKHVVRQRVVENKNPTTIRPPPPESKSITSPSSKPPPKSMKKRDHKTTTGESNQKKLKRYLQCEEFRSFRKEIENIATT